MNNQTLIKMLRICSNSEQSCEPCPFFGKANCVDCLLNEAANALSFLTCDKETKKAEKPKKKIRLESALNADPYLFSPYLYRLSDCSIENIYRRYNSTV